MKLSPRSCIITHDTCHHKKRMVSSHDKVGSFKPMISVIRNTNINQRLNILLTHDARLFFLFPFYFYSIFSIEHCHLVSACELFTYRKNRVIEY